MCERPLGFSQLDEHPSAVPLQTPGPGSQSGIASAGELDASEELIVTGVLVGPPQERPRGLRCCACPGPCLSASKTPKSGVRSFNVLDRHGEVAKSRSAGKHVGVGGEPCRLVRLARQVGGEDAISPGRCRRVALREEDGRHKRSD